jgi:cold shock protein
MGAKGPPRLEGSTEGGEETTPALFEVSGSVKWFDPSNGYGIIIPDDDLPEILLHVTASDAAASRPPARAHVRSVKS